MDSPLTPNPGYVPAWPVYKEVGADLVGEVIDGRFRIIRRLAKGGMAHVFLAKDQTRKCYVAIKLLRTISPQARRRFAVEAEVLSNIQHPNIVRAIAFGELDGQPYMALEYLDGETASQRLSSGPLPWREVAEIGAQVAEALHALHRLGVIHRDIKPDNIMITISGDRSIAKLIDLGLASVGVPFHEVQDARFTPPPIRHKTELGQPIGTPDYLPPEAGQRDADPLLDVYLLGATLYQLCTQLLPKLTGGRPIREVNPQSDAPEDFSRLLLAALAPDPADRLPSADHLRRGLQAILAAHPRTPRPGYLFGGSFDRLEVIGVGASSIVFRASDRWLSREVALKVLRNAKPSEDDAIRFRRAAKILSALRHPNIPRILSFGIDEDQMFAATELCTGSPAIDFASPFKHLRPDEVIALGRQLAGALAAVHAIDVVYRDLHLGNILIARGEVPHAWLYDFDHAQVSPVFYARLTERWATPPEERAEPASEPPLQNMDYAAPEVRGGAAFTAASDVYALGLVLYRLLTGLRALPPGGTEPRPARMLCPACPPGLDSLLTRMMYPAPSGRPTLDAIEIALACEQEELEAAAREEAAELAARAALNKTTGAADTAAAILAPALAESATIAGAPEVAASTSDVALDQPAATSSIVVDAPTQATQATTVTHRPGSSSNARAVLLLAIVAGVSVGIGRASVSRDNVEATGAERAINIETAEQPPGTGAHVASEQQALQIKKEQPEISPEVLSATPAAPTLPAKPAIAPTRARRREPVTTAEATTAARRAVAGLRGCTGVPSVVTADLDIARGRGIVVALNAHALAPNDPRFTWHACAQSQLERVRFPASDTPGRVRVRLPLE